MLFLNLLQKCLHMSWVSSIVQATGPQPQPKLGQVGHWLVLDSPFSEFCIYSNVTT